MSPVKTLEQIEFLDLMTTGGLSQADVARLLLMSPGAVSRIVNGENNPRPRTLELLRRVVEEKIGRPVARPEDSSQRYPEGTGGVTFESNVLEKAQADLKELAEADPAKLREVANIITTYRQTTKKKKKASSVKDIADQIVGDAVEEIRNKRKSKPE